MVTRALPIRSLRQRRERRPPDWGFVAATLALTALGLLMSYSTTFFWEEGVTTFLRQAAFAALGLAAFVATANADYGIARRYAVRIMLVCLALLVAVLLFGEEHFGARRTLLNNSVQPSEVAKVGLIIYAAAWLSSRREQVRSFMDGLIPFGIIAGSVAFLVVIQPDFSTAAVLVLIALVMFFLAGASIQQMVLVFLVALLAFAGLTQLFPHAVKRIQGFISLWSTAGEPDYHIRQSLISLGEGGLFGNGLGAGRQKFGFLPTPHHDSVVAVLGEEMGLVGLVATLVLFVIFAWRGIVIAHHADTAFGAFVAVGIVAWVIGQMLLNVLAVLALIPFTGMPMPFLSQGGSSLVALLASAGLVVSVSRGSRVLIEPSSSIGDQGGKHVYAGAPFRRRHRRSRFARLDRLGGTEQASARFTSIVRWRRKRYGA
ncbi:MAG: FtsW/RodA/SpoVE family cell cycle protein [Anaerolineae bacterium]|nr:FtsW/RodA/SpoVE family cell cycle protein [Anaerolineae bacterium]